MRDLFKRLNNTGYKCNISTFSKANLHRSQAPFIKIYQQLNQIINQKKQNKYLSDYIICPIDSTIITLTSKLLWILGYHQVKLFSSLNLASGTPEDNLIIFGQGHDYKHGEPMMSNLPENGVGVMDRGFAGLKFIQQLSDEKKFFVLRISNSWKLGFDEETGLVKVGSGQNSGLYRVVSFCDLKTQIEYRLVTNLPFDGEAQVSNEEVMEIYRCRWGVE